MKKKTLSKVVVAALTTAMAFTTVACGSDSTSSTGSSNSSSAGSSTTASNGDTDTVESSIIEYADLDLDSDCKDLVASIAVSSNRTDLDDPDYAGVTWDVYLEEFAKLYPNISVTVNTITDYDSTVTVQLQSGSYDAVTLIPSIDKADLSYYYRSYGTYDVMSELINYADSNMYSNEVYGIPQAANAGGIVYNKRIFEEAGITELPTTPSEFIDALTLISENTDAIPLYTNYAAGWALSGQWDAYIGIAATGDVTYMNQKLAHTENPFQDYGDETHAYAVYKILYDAVANGLTEEGYMTTDWESSKSKMNNGEIACMVLGSWALPQMKLAGDNPDDVGYMPFPISVDGVQYAAASADKCFGINKNLSDEETQAAIIFVKWFTERSGYAYNEYSLPVYVEAETQLSFDGVVLLQDEPANEGEEDFINSLNSTSEVNINQDGDGVRLQRIIESAANGTETYDEIVSDWNEAWSSAQESLDIEVLY